MVVAARDLPVGTMFTREDLAKAVKTVHMSKDGLPPSYVAAAEDLLDKRLTRTMRSGEALHPLDLSKGGITLPEGDGLVSLEVGVGQAASGFVVPGSRVNVIATTAWKTRCAFALLVNVLVVAVDTQSASAKDGPFPVRYTVSFATTEKQALLLALAKQRGCSLELLLRHPNKDNEADKTYNLDEVFKFLNEEKPADGKE